MFANFGAKLKFEFSPQESSGQQASENEEEKKLSNEAVQPVK